METLEAFKKELIEKIEYHTEQLRKLAEVQLKLRDLEEELPVKESMRSGVWVHPDGSKIEIKEDRRKYSKGRPKKIMYKKKFKL